MSLRRTTRRSFIGVAGAALSAPLAAAGPVLATASPPPLDDIAAIRALTQGYARHVNDREVESGIRRVTSDGFGEHDTITIAPDGDAATAVLHCTVEIESAIGPACTLVEMARQQGGGVTRHTERGVFELACVKCDGVWNILWNGYRPCPP